MSAAARQPWRWLRAAAALAATTALLAGPPYALARFIGWPLPRHLLTWPRLRLFLTTPLSDDAIVKGLACVVWLLWAIFALSLIIEAVSAVRGHPAPRLPVIAPIQAFAAALIGASILTSIPISQASPRALPLHAVLTTEAIATAPPQPARPPQASGTAPAAAPVGYLLQGGDSHHTAPSRPAPRPRIHRVVEGDNLWDIAARNLGDGERWREIYDLNAGKPQPDGRTLTDPDLIYPGWVLLLPPLEGHQNTSARHGRPAAQKPPPGQQAVPTPASSPRSSATTLVPSSTATSRPATANQRHETHPTMVELPSGVLIGVSLASALGVAVVLMRMHQQRRRQPAPVPGTAPAEPDLSPALRRVRQAHLTSYGQTDPDTDLDTELTPDQCRSQTASTVSENRAAKGEIPPPELVSTETINVAARDGDEIVLHLDCAPGVGIDGPGAEGAVRAIMVTLLARRTKDPAEIIVTGDDAARLLAPGPADSGLPSVAGLVIVPSFERAMSRLEAEIVHRRRLLDDDSGTDDIASYRALHPDEHLPTILLVAPAEQPQAGRLTATLTLGRPLGITGILLGSWSPGSTCTVAADGQVTAVGGHELQHLSGARMFQLAPDEAVQMLATLSAAGGSDTGLPSEPPARAVAAPEAADEPEAGTRPVRLCILGPPGLEASGQPITKGLRRKGYELLAYLACHRDGATTEAIVEALWPNLPARRAGVIFHTVITNIRQVLRTATGASEAGFVPWIRDRYRIDAALIDVDLWRFQAALGRAARASSDSARQEALHTAAALWRGDLAAGHDGEWIDSWRETLRRDAADALTRLAELCQHDSPDEAIALLERATTVERYQESLYQRIIQIQGTLGRRDAARRTYQLLESRLTEIDAEPDEATTRLLHETLHSRDGQPGVVGSG